MYVEKWISEQVYIDAANRDGKSNTFRCRNLPMNMPTFIIAMVSVNLIGVLSPGAAPYKELVPHFDCQKSTVMIRKIANPTLANLDAAAYEKNPVLQDMPERKPKKALLKGSRDDLLFGGVLTALTNETGATPLTASELDNPLAWKPLVKRAWQVVKDNTLSDISSKIAGVKWGDADVYLPYQEIATAFVHDAQGEKEIWVKIEFAPWADVMSYPADNDHDGIKEIYGKLVLDKMEPDSLGKLTSWMVNDYMRRLLDREQTTDWVTELASYWYPTRNTDIVPLGKEGVWPDAATPKKIRKQIGSLTVNNPVAIIEGKPVSPDKPIYNVFVVDFETVQTLPEPVRALQAAKETRDTTQMKGDFSTSYYETARALRKEIATNGTWVLQAQRIEPVHASLRKILAETPREQMAFVGTEGWLYFRKSIEYIVGGDLELQEDSRNPVRHITMLGRYLQTKNIDLLIVPVPCKEEVYPEFIGNGVTIGKGTVINPFGRKVIASLLQNGIEVVDLLPVFLEEKKNDAEFGVLYQKQDTHWNGRGLKIAAHEIVKHLKASARYQSWGQRTKYLTKDTLVTRSGDMVERLPPEKQQTYAPEQMLVQQVRQQDGKLYQSNLPGAPVLLIGDSYTGVFEHIDCKSAGVGAHIAMESGLPVDIITSWGGGPLVRQKMLRMRGADLDKKRIVIYMMTTRDLYNYQQGWDDLQEHAPQ